MTRRDYVEISKIIRESDSGQYDAYTNKVVLVDMLGEYFKKTNPRFDFERFQKSCYSEEVRGVESV